MATAQHPALDRVPELPSEAVRAAIALEDWDAAAGLLESHHGEIVFALSKVDLKVSARQPWLDLLAAHGVLIEELRVARDAASEELARLGHGRRGAAAWMRALA